MYLPQPNNANFTNAFTIYSEKYVQLGSYFGGALLSLDVNGDDVDDLMVAAPLFIGTNYDDGRVYVYLSNNKNNNPKIWVSYRRKLFGLHFSWRNDEVRGQGQTFTSWDATP